MVLTLAAAILSTSITCEFSGGRVHKHLDGVPNGYHTIEVHALDQARETLLGCKECRTSGYMYSRAVLCTKTIIETEEPVDPTDPGDPTPSVLTKDILMRWVKPTQRDDGSELLPGDIWGYILNITHKDGTIENITESTSEIIIDDPDVLSYTINEGPAGTYTVYASTLDTRGTQSTEIKLTERVLGLNRAGDMLVWLEPVEPPLAASITPALTPDRKYLIKK